MAIVPAAVADSNCERLLSTPAHHSPPPARRPRLRPTFLRPSLRVFFSALTLIHNIQRRKNERERKKEVSISRTDVAG